jgi:hypothetical protein
MDSYMAHLSVRTINQTWPGAPDGTDGKRLKKLRDEVGGQRSDFPISRFQISAFALGSPRSPQDFTAKLFYNVEFWIACPPSCPP